MLAEQITAGEAIIVGLLALLLIVLMVLTSPKRNRLFLEEVDNEPSPDTGVNES